ncbi:Cell division protein FtsB [compost metagenome]
MSRERAGSVGSKASASPKTGASRKRIRLVTIGVLALTMWAGATVWSQMKRTDEIAIRLEALGGKLNDTVQMNEKLKREVERMSDPEYREERIRKDNHMFKQGETVFDVPRTTP